eukprot:scaffold315135_cov26-Tisochrysis_lutea.AAC.1
MLGMRSPLPKWKLGGSESSTEDAVDALMTVLRRGTVLALLPMAGWRRDLCTMKKMTIASPTRRDAPIATTTAIPVNVPNHVLSPFWSTSSRAQPCRSSGGNGGHKGVEEGINCGDD